VFSCSGYDVLKLTKYLDWISVMTYDFHGHWDKKTGHVAPLYYYPGDTYDYFNAVSSTVTVCRTSSAGQADCLLLSNHGLCHRLCVTVVNKKELCDLVSKHLFHG
jgi:hypothetical protein